MAGQQSFLTLSQENYHDKFGDVLLKEADLYYLNIKFMVGGEVNKDKVRHAQMFHNALCTDECELIDWVVKKLNGDLEEIKHKVKVKDFKVYDFGCGIDELNNSTNECCDWAQLEW